MKQHINFDQWNDLTEKQKLKLDTWLMKSFAIAIWHPTSTRTEYILHRLMTIGEMIEFLDEHIDYSYQKIIITNGLKKAIWWPRNEKWIVGYGRDDQNVKESKNNYFSDELCNALWEAVKEVLEKQL